MRLWMHRACNILLGLFGVYFILRELLSDPPANTNVLLGILGVVLVVILQKITSECDRRARETTALYRAWFRERGRCCSRDSSATVRMMVPVASTWERGTAGDRERRTVQMCVRRAEHSRPSTTSHCTEEDT